MEKKNLHMIFKPQNSILSMDQTAADGRLPSLATELISVDWVLNLIHNSW